jgi:hypothetical protein
VGVWCRGETGQCERAAAGLRRGSEPVEGGQGSQRAKVMIRWTVVCRGGLALRTCTFNPANRCAVDALLSVPRESQSSQQPGIAVSWSPPFAPDATTCAGDVLNPDSSSSSGRGPVLLCMRLFVSLPTTKEATIHPSPPRVCLTVPLSTYHTLPLALWRALAPRLTTTRPRHQEPRPSSSHTHTASLSTAGADCRIARYPRLDDGALHCIARRPRASTLDAWRFPLRSPP